MGSGQFVERSSAGVSVLAAGTYNSLGGALVCTAAQLPMHCLMLCFAIPGGLPWEQTSLLCDKQLDILAPFLQD